MLPQKIMGYRPIPSVVLVFSIVIALIFSSVTVIRAENSMKDAEHTRACAEAVERMRRGFENFEESIDISDLGINPSELGKLFADATKDTPYLFYVSNNLAYSYRTGGCVVTVNPKYTMDKTEAEEAIEYCRSEVKKMAEMVRDRKSELERLVGAHDLICSDYSYDISLESNNVYTFLKTGKGTCQGYTWTYMAILRELGIECRYVASDTIAHIWLAVKIDGEWYHTDVTWDDPPFMEGSGKHSRAHLLFSDGKADRDGYKDRYSSLDLKCNSKKYDGRELLSDIPFCAFSGDADHDGEVTLYDLLLLRLYLENGGIPGRDVCVLCADTDGNHLIDDEDVGYIRYVILGQ